jgi:hypothetical protein
MTKNHPGGPNPICHLCNRFMSWKDMDEGVSWSPCGTTYDLDPPEEEYAHRSCWDGAGEERRALIRKISWCGPFIHRQTETT